MIWKEGNIIYGDEGIITMQVLYNESVANDWDIQKIGDTYICPHALHIIGSASFYLGYYVRDEILDFTIPDYPHSYALYVNSTGNVNIGRQEDDYRYCFGAVINGKNIVENLARRFYFKAANITITNSFISNWYYGYCYPDIDGDIINLAVNKLQFGLATNANTRINGLNCFNAYYGAQINYVEEGNGITVSNCARALLLAGSGDITLRNIKITNCEQSDTYVRSGNVLYRNYNLVDCQIDKSKMQFYLSGSLNALTQAIQRLSSTYNIITNTNSTINIYNNLDELVYTGNTGEVGEITEEIEYYKKFRIVDNGEITEEGEIDYEPFKVVISKTGYETTTIEDVYVTAGQPTIIRATLKGKISYNYSTPLDYIKYTYSLLNSDDDLNNKVYTLKSGENTSLPYIIIDRNIKNDYNKDDLNSDINISVNIYSSTYSNSIELAEKVDSILSNNNYKLINSTELYNDVYIQRLVYIIKIKKSV